MSYTKDRECTIHLFGKLGISLQDTRAILKLASGLQRLSILACEIQLLDKEVRRKEMLRRKLCAITSGYPDTILGVDTSGDPRGYCVKLSLKCGLSNELGGQWGIPTRT